jgi:Protein of unknown function (DUF2505)
MSRPIDYRTVVPFPAERVFAAMADPEYLRARLRQLGGPGAELLEHSADAGGVRYRLRQGLEKDVLPAIVQSLVGGNLVIERTESLRPDAGGYHGDVDVDVPGAPVIADGSMSLRDVDGGSEFAVHAQVSVRVPLLGGRIEGVVAEQVQKLLAAETGFTREWLAALNR